MQESVKIIYWLKSIDKHQPYPLEVFLVIANNKNITLYECRRFMFHKYASKVYNWKQKDNEELLVVSKECLEYILSNRSKWDIQYEVNKQSILKYHSAYEKMRIKLNFDRHLKRKALINELKKHYQQPNISSQNEETQQKQIIVFRQQLREFIAIVQSISKYEQEEQKYLNTKDSEYNQVISEALTNYHRQKNQLISHRSKQMAEILEEKKKKEANSTKLNKSQSVKLPRLSLFSQQRSLSDKLKEGKRKNFIQQIKRQIENQEKSLGRSKKSEELSPSRKYLLQSSLPKILKIPNEKIQSQGIYQSLKKFATFDYLNQEKKIKNIIGLPMGDDQEYMKAYFKRESQVKQQKQAYINNLRQQRKKQVLQKLSKNQSICRKSHLEEIEPYMRF